VPSLLLHPDEPGWVPEDRLDFVTLLGEVGLIDAPTGAADTNDFWLGRHFLTLVMFLGCSPNIVIRPQNAAEGQPVSRLHYHLYRDTRFLSGRKSPSARCPHCRAPADGVVPSAPDRPFSCPQCGRVSAACVLDWRQSAGFGRCFLEITGIYPHEAVPSDRLMETLRGYSGSVWRYFYAG
jgi:hypothetical protein